MFRNNSDYIASFYKDEPEFIQKIRNSCPENLRKMQMSYSECRILSLMLKMIGANRVLELGTLVGCSAAWIASSLIGDNPCVVSVEKSKNHYEIAKENIENTDLSNVVQLIHDDALNVLQSFVDKEEIFDVIFIDAKKIEYGDYLTLAKKCVRSGGLIIADNTLMINDNMPEISSAIRGFNDIIEKDIELSSAILPTVAGMTVAMKI